MTLSERVARLGQIFMPKCSLHPPRLLSDKYALGVPAIFISMMATGHFFPQTGFGATLSDGSGMYVLDKLDGLSAELGFGQYTEGSKSMIDVFAITGALMVGTAGLPHVIVRFFTVPRVKDTRISAAWTLVFIAIVYTTAPAVASFARVNMIDTINGKDGSGTEYAEAPAWVKNWERTGLITFNDKNGDGKMTCVNSSSTGVARHVYTSQVV